MTALPNIDHPTDRANFSIVRNPGYLPSVAFSYETPIAFTEAGGYRWTVSENLWGPTTGKHLNHLSTDVASRVRRADFERELSAAFAEGARRNHLAVIAEANAEAGDSGQDHESYTDDQDHESYEVTS